MVTKCQKVYQEMSKHVAKYQFALLYNNFPYMDLNNSSKSEYVDMSKDVQKIIKDICYDMCQTHVQNVKKYIKKCQNM